MKKINKLSIFALLALVSCSEPDTEVAPFDLVLYKETFSTDIVNEDEYLDITGWTNFAEAGSVKWTEQDDDNNGYIQFTTFNSGTGDVSNIAWAVTPKINLDNTENEILTFKSAAEFVTNSANKLEVLISNNFDGTNVLAATWVPLTANIAGLSTSGSTPDGVLNVNSGEVNLSTYTGNVYIAFKATGSSTNSDLDGSLRVDDIKIYPKK
jgi:hypothetical protein